MEKKLDRTCTNNCSDVCGECQIPTKKTAVNWLIEQLFDKSGIKVTAKNNPELFALFAQAKQLEKQQIVDAVDGHPIQNRHLDGEQYYAETYGSERSS